MKDISALRKAGFSISDIKSIQQDQANSTRIIAELKNRFNHQMREQAETLTALNGFGRFTTYSVHELASCLADANNNRQNPEDDKFSKVKEI